MKNYLSVVITTYNEANKIGRDIEAVNKFAAKLKKSVELTIVDDRSSDKTIDVVRKKQKKYPWIKLFTVKGKIHGKGRGLKVGITKANGKYIMFADAGLCIPFDNAILGINKIEEGYDVSIGSRTLKKSKITYPQPWYRQLGSRLFWLFIKFFMGIPRGIRDTQCGFKIYTNQAAKKLYRHSFTPGFMIDVETLLRAKKLNLKISQFPVTWTNDPDTRFNVFSGSIKNIKELIQIKQRL